MGISYGWIVVAVLVAVWLVPCAFTAAGAVRRGNRLGLALLTGLFFPVAWVVWYLVDERRQGGTLFLRADGRDRQERDR